MKIFKISETIFFTYFEYAENDDGIYFAHKCKYLLQNSRTEFCVVKCGVPQGSILGPLLFLLSVNDLKNASSILDPIMFADDTNLFYTHRNIQNLF